MLGTKAKSLEIAAYSPNNCAISPDQIQKTLKEHMHDFQSLTRFTHSRSQCLYPANQDSAQRKISTNLKAYGHYS